MNITATTTSGAITPLIPTSAVMTILGRSRQTICAWARQGVIPAIRMPDGNYMFDSAVIETWIKERSTK